MNQVRPARWRVVTTLLSALVTVAAACGGSDDDGDDAAGAVTTTFDVEVDDTTTSMLPATTTTLSEADRFRTLAVELITARNDLYQDPPADPAAALAEIVDPQCTCFDVELGALTDMISQGGRFSGPPSMPLGVRFTGFDPATQSAFVDMALDASPRQLLDSGGAVIRQLEGAEPIAMRLGLAQVEGQWRIDIIGPLEVDRRFVDELVAEGVP